MLVHCESVLTRDTSGDKLGRLSRSECCSRLYYTYPLNRICAWKRGKLHIFPAKIFRDCCTLSNTCSVFGMQKNYLKRQLLRWYASDQDSFQFPLQVFLFLVIGYTARSLPGLSRASSKLPKEVNG
jgi:hypothetical protein